MIVFGEQGPLYIVIKCRQVSLKATVCSELISDLPVHVGLKVTLKYIFILNILIFLIYQLNLLIMFLSLINNGKPCCK